MHNPIVSHSPQSDNFTPDNLIRMAQFLTSEAKRSDRLCASTGDFVHQALASAARDVANELASAAVGDSR